MGDGGPLESAEREAYMRVLRHEQAPLLDEARPGDVVILHDPQTAGLIAPLVDAGMHVVWVCHVGVDTPDDLVLLGVGLPAVTTSDPRMLTSSPVARTYGRGSSAGRQR